MARTHNIKRVAQTVHLLIIIIIIMAFVVVRVGTQDVPTLRLLGSNRAPSQIVRAPLWSHIAGIGLASRGE